MSYIIISIIFPTRIIDIYGFRTFIIVSPSMEPTLMVNDMIVITDVEKNDIKENDIITFKAYIPELTRYSYVTNYVVSIESSNTVKTI